MLELVLSLCLTQQSNFSGHTANMPTCRSGEAVVCIVSPDGTKVCRCKVVYTI